MHVFTWLYDAHLTIAGHPITWREILGNAFGFASAVGGLRRRVWAWPVGIVGNVLLFTVFIGATFQAEAQVPLFGQAGRQVFFVVTSVYGWWRWNQVRGADHNAPAITPRWATSLRASPLLAVIPSATNIAAKARQKSSAGPRICARPRPSWRSANETPEMVER